MMISSSDAAANHDQTIDELCSDCHSVSCHLTELSESFLGSSLISFTLAIGDLADLLGFEIMVIISGSLGINALDCTDSHTFLNDDTLFELVGETESLNARIVATVKLAIHHDADTETGAESVADEILISL